VQKILLIHVPTEGVAFHFFDQPCIRLLALTPDYCDVLRSKSLAVASDDFSMSAAWCADTASCTTVSKGFGNLRADGIFMATER
jgi:hypothetical protein